MLAYLFWHYPQDGVDRADYESTLCAFHAELRDAARPELRTSTAFRVSGLPWINASGDAYEDWYVVDDWSAFGALNTVAVSGESKASHDRAAHAMQLGAGGVYAIRAERHGRLAATSAQWISKPKGMPYETFDALVAPLLADGCTLWRRMMVLGPGLEFCLTAPRPVALPHPLEGIAVERHALREEDATG